jgi:predicted Zn-dependent protease
MFAKLQQASRLNDSGNFHYLRSHPLSTERMADMQSRIDLPDAETATQPVGRQNTQEVDHAMVAARARVLSNSTVDALRTWSLEVDAAHRSRQSPAQQAASLYGATLAAIKLRDFTEAQLQWVRLGEQVRGDAAAARLARLLGVELMLAKGDSVRALELLNGGQGATAKSNRAELFLGAQAHLQTRSGLDTLTQNLRVWVAAHPRDAQAWQLLSSAYAGQGRTLSSIRAQAEVSAAHLDFTSALSRFKAAQEWARRDGAAADHFEASIVDTRTRQIELLLKEQALER